MLWLALSEAGLLRLLPPPRPPGVQREPSFHYRVPVRVLWRSRSFAFSKLLWERGEDLCDQTYCNAILFYITCVGLFLWMLLWCELCPLSLLRMCDSYPGSRIVSSSQLTGVWCYQSTVCWIMLYKPILDISGSRHLHVDSLSFFLFFFASGRHVQAELQ